MGSSVTKDFFFISYNWNNTEVIEEDVPFFTQNSVNYWIDKDFEGMRLYDDSWLERVRQTVHNEHCKGAVFYLSVNSLRSDSVEKEIDIILNMRKTNPDFFVFAILLGGMSIPHLIKQVYASVEDARLANVLPLSRIAKLNELFSDEKIYLYRNTDHLNEYYDRLLANLTLCGVVDCRSSIEEKLIKRKQLDAYGRYGFGMFYEGDPIPNVYFTEENRYIERNGAYFIRLSNGSVYKAKAIKWIILDYKDDVLTLISECAVETRRGSDISRWLNEDFLNLAFNEKEKALLVETIRILTFEEYEEYSREADINPTKGSFWLGSINIRKQQNMLMYVNGTVVDKIGKNKSAVCGVRPVIRIRMQNI